MATEFALLTQLHDHIGITKLAAALDLPYYTCRSMLNSERVSDAMAKRVRAHLPAAVERYLPEFGTPSKTRRRRAEARRKTPLGLVEADTQETLATLMPYVSTGRLAHTLGLSKCTLQAAVAGYRRMHAATVEALQAQLSDLLRPPYDALRPILNSPPRSAALRGLRTGLFAPIRGLDAQETEALLLGETATD